MGEVDDAEVSAATGHDSSLAIARFTFVIPKHVCRSTRHQDLSSGTCEIVHQRRVVVVLVQMASTNASAKLILV
jgi:hypothetical protein